MLQKFAGPLAGAPFCGASVRPYMLNMPKAASDRICTNYRSGLGPWAVRGDEQLLHLLHTSYATVLFSSPNLSARRLDVYHTSTHGVSK